MTKRDELEIGVNSSDFDPDRQTDRQTDRKTDRKTANKQTEIEPTTNYMGATSN